MMNSSPRPESVRTYGYTGLAGLIAALAAIYALPIPDFWRAPLGIAAAGVPIIARILLRRECTLFAPIVNELNWGRVATKMLGLMAAWGLMLGAYWLFPEYKGSFYTPYYNALGQFLPFLMVLAIPYIALVDVRQTDPHDGGWMMGALILGRWDQVDRQVVLQFLLGWAVKGFFLPIMFVSTADDLRWLAEYHRDWSRVISTEIMEDIIRILFLVDVTYAAAGYVLTLRLLDTQIRSAEPTVAGWFVALMCYLPFWNALFGPRYLAYGDDNWHVLLASWPVMHWMWASVIFVLLGIYAWATVSFGIRFSNLTNRGILTHGPYRWTKHPAYLSKNLTWWMMAVPFIAGSAEDAVRNCLLLAGVNLIYFARAKTEERHLSQDPDYVAYAQWMEQNGIFTRLRGGLAAVLTMTGFRRLQ
jgi:protein-S-isoprenylcysteine O-methyltransferase Ste14